MFFLALGVAGATASLAQTDEEVAAARLAYIDGDYVGALAVLRPAADAGDPIAQNIMGDAYDDGHGVTQDFAVARDWFERAAAQDFDKAIYNLGLWYVEGRPGVAQDYRKAAEYYDRAVALGYHPAMNNRALMFESGQGGPVDMEQAADLYGQAAEAGNGLAMANLGRLYVDGNGVDEDMAEALRLFRNGAAIGNTRAISNLGAMYENGYGVEQDSIAATALYFIAAQRGNAQAAVNLAYQLIEGPEGLRDASAGWAWCQFGMEHADSNQDFSDDCEYLGDLLDAATRARGVELMPDLRP